MDSSYRVEVETSIGPLTGLFSCPLCLAFFLCIACAAKPQKLAAIKNPPAMLKPISKLPTASYTAPTIGAPIIEAIPCNINIKPSDEVKLPSPKGQ